MNFAVLETPAKVFSTKFGRAIPIYDRFQHFAKVLSAKWSLLPIHESFLPRKFPAIQYYYTPNLENVQQELYNSTSFMVYKSSHIYLYLHQTSGSLHTTPDQWFCTHYARPVVLYTLRQTSGSLHTTPDQWFSTHYTRRGVLYTLRQTSGSLHTTPDQWFLHTTPDQWFSTH